jgi:hypothetical protein
MGDKGEGYFSREREERPQLRIFPSFLLNARELTDMFVGLQKKIG